MNKIIKRLLIIAVAVSAIMTIYGTLTAFAQDSVGITYSKEYTSNRQIKTFSTPDELVFEGTVAQLPDRNFTITINPDKGTDNSELKCNIEDVWVGKSIDGQILPISRSLFTSDGSKPEVHKTGDYIYNLEGLNIEENVDYGFFIDVNLRDSIGRTDEHKTFATFFKIDPSTEKQVSIDTNTSKKKDTITCYWLNNETGWWVQRSDGTYLTNQWYCSPESNLWYYLGADGYMLTNTVTPDGYRVNVDGVWVY